LRKGRQEMAKKLLLMGMNLQDIQAITELSVSEIESIK
jgi:hypothetical protein